MKRLIKSALVQLLARRGYDPYSAHLRIENMTRDLLENRRAGLRKKLWAYRHGFLSAEIDNYGLTEENYHMFLSDGDYDRLHPLNGYFGKWIDDKLTAWYVLHPFRDHLPRYYYHICTADRILPLPDCDPECRANMGAIIDLLRREGRLALKMLAGSSGAGFYKLAYEGQSFSINDCVLREPDLERFLGGLNDYLVTEHVTSHPELARIFSRSSNTARIMVINENGQDPLIANAFIRFGTGRSGHVDNVSAGGIFAIVDVESGRYYDAKRLEHHRAVPVEIHPDTGALLSGVLPNWVLVRTRLLEISRYLPELSYMGFDVAITGDGFKILEINSLQNISGFQYHSPLLSGNPAADFFTRRIARHKAE